MSLIKEINHFKKAIIMIVALEMSSSLRMIPDFSLLDTHVIKGMLFVVFFNHICCDMHV